MCTERHFCVDILYFLAEAKSSSSIAMTTYSDDQSINTLYRTTLCTCHVHTYTHTDTQTHTQTYILTSADKSLSGDELLR